MITEIRDRLSSQVPALKLVEGAVEFAALMNGEPRLPTATPAAFVLPLTENPSPSPFGNGVVIQAAPVEVGIVYCARNVADARGEAANADLQVLRRAGRDALLAWTPGTEDSPEPLERGPGQLLAFRAGAVWWQDIYRTTIHFRSQ